MCGRFVGYRTLQELQTYFPIDKAACEVAASYNVAPSQEILAIVKHGDEHLLDKLHWGLVPFWAKEASIGRKLINARSETVARKPSFRNAFNKRRCLIPADGFYEWTGQKGAKQPVYITLPNEDPFAFAGVWEIWRNTANPEMHYQSCTILTIAASHSVRPIHHRMPVVLRPEAYADWLDPAQIHADNLKARLSDAIQTEFAFVPVTKQVNSVSNNDPTNITPYRQAEFDF